MPADVPVINPSTGRACHYCLFCADDPSVRRTNNRNKGAVHSFAMCGRLCDELDPSTMKKLKENCADYTCEKSNLAVWSSQAGACFACIRKADPTSSVLPRSSANTTARIQMLVPLPLTLTHLLMRMPVMLILLLPLPRLLRLRLQLPAQMKVSQVVELLLHP